MTLILHPSVAGYIMQPLSGESERLPAEPRRPVCLRLVWLSDSLGGPLLALDARPGFTHWRDSEQLSPDLKATAAGRRGRWLSLAARGQHESLHKQPKATRISCSSSKRSALG